MHAKSSLEREAAVLIFYPESIYLTNVLLAS